ncbi:DUF4301 family protein [Ascidiimonas aurantiaca]|uniref:DUF4301 family protein n=1 Tax=Ascidiimonas aurantiaca TaxID=1685432 RepID=UPI0030EC3809
MITNTDFDLIKKKGIKKEEIEKQIAIFKKGIPFVTLEDSATVGNGILKFTSEEETTYEKIFNEKAKKASLLKFVPASGAASRMFKTLFNFLEEFKVHEETLEVYVKRTHSDSLPVFFDHAEKFPFYKPVLEAMGERDKNAAGLASDEQKHKFIKQLLSEEYMGFGAYPKGLLPFHTYKNETRTAFEEHLYEAAAYGVSNGVAKLHFTVSEHHMDKFKAKLQEEKQKIEKQTQVQFEVSFSVQKPSTDTIAVTPANEPFRNASGELVFRPSGHGALIENLNMLDADIVFIKNIDNVVVENRANVIHNSKKVLAGKLFELQERAFSYMRILKNEAPDEARIYEIRDFVKNELYAHIPSAFNTWPQEDKIQFLCHEIDRPIRICGMVKNEGEPGGGPFWVRDNKGEISLQIIESAQIDKSDSKQLKILETATHFNPVDLVCGIKDYEGKKYDLLKYTDPAQGFISSKTYEGRELKALELPGLWNGAMAGWHTVFAEVPLATFNPVKTVIDLLKPAHQVQIP